MMQKDISLIFSKDYVLNGKTMSVHLVGIEEKNPGNCGVSTTNYYSVYIINDDENAVFYRSFYESELEDAISLYERLIAIAATTDEGRNHKSVDDNKSDDDISIEEMLISVQTVRILRVHCGIKTIGDLRTAAMTPLGLSGIKNAPLMGPKRVKELIDAAAHYDIYFEPNLRKHEIKDASVVKKAEDSIMVQSGRHYGFVGARPSLKVTERGDSDVVVNSSDENIVTAIYSDGELHLSCLGLGCAEVTLAKGDSQSGVTVIVKE